MTAIRVGISALRWTDRSRDPPSNNDMSIIYQYTHKCVHWMIVKAIILTTREFCCWQVHWCQDRKWSFHFKVQRRELQLSSEILSFHSFVLFVDERYLNAMRTMPLSLCQPYKASLAIVTSRHFPLSSYDFPSSGIHVNAFINKRPCQCMSEPWQRTWTPIS